MEERVEEQKSLRSPTILLQARSLELREQERWVGGESDKSSELGRLGWADPSPVRGGPPDEQGAKPLERSRHAEAMAGTSLWARFYRQIRRHPAVSSVPVPPILTLKPVADPEAPISKYPAFCLLSSGLLIFLHGATGPSIYTCNMPPCPRIHLAQARCGVRGPAAGTSVGEVQVRCPRGRARHRGDVRVPPGRNACGGRVGQRGWG